MCIVAIEIVHYCNKKCALLQKKVCKSVKHLVGKTNYQEASQEDRIEPCNMTQLVLSSRSDASLKSGTSGYISAILQSLIWSSEQSSHKL